MMVEEIYGPIISIVGTAFFGWLLVNGFRTGTMVFPPAPTVELRGRRTDQPVRFWLVAIWLAFWAIGCAFATIGQLFFPNGI